MTGLHAHGVPMPKVRLTLVALLSWIARGPLTQLSADPDGELLMAGVKVGVFEEEVVNTPLVGLRNWVIVSPPPASVTPFELSMVTPLRVREGGISNPVVLGTLS